MKYVVCLDTIKKIFKTAWKLVITANLERFVVPQITAPMSSKRWKLALTET